MGSTATAKQTRKRTAKQPKPVPPIIVTRDQITDLLGIQPQNLGKHIKAGKVPPPVSHGKYDLKACLFAYVQNVNPLRGKQAETGPLLGTDHMDRIEADRKLKIEQYRKLKIENDLREGEVVLVTDMKRSWANIRHAVISNINELPARLAAPLAALTNPAEVRVRIEKEVHRALTAIADTPPGGMQTEGDHEETFGGNS